MNIIGIIPARYASTRFPGKPLVDLGGKTMIQRVYEQCKKAETLSDVIVATDDTRIKDYVEAFGGNVMLTSAEHQSGTDRCAEVVRKYNGLCDAVINIQGDEPFINPFQIEQLCAAFHLPHTQLATMKKKIVLEGEIQNPNCVKVTANTQHEALYFSRSVIPFPRGLSSDIVYYKHIGIYGYRKETLLEITNLPMGSLEKAESLEQLRWLENGYRITLVETEMENIAIDTPEDLLLVEKYLKTE